MSLAERELTANPPADGDLPEGWVQACLRDGLLTSVQPGFACGTNSRDIGGVAHLRPMNVSREGTIDLANTKFVPRAEGSREERWIRRGDVLFNNTNSAELVGKTAYYDDPETRLFSNHMTRLRCNAEVLDAQYCAMALHQRWREGYFAGRCNNHVSQASISSGVLLDTEITVPPLAEQRRIVAKAEQLLAAANTTRARLARVPTLLKRFRQSVLAAACSGRLTADWRQQNPDVEPASRLLERILAERRAKWEGEQRVKTRKRPSGTLEMDLAGSVVEPLSRKQQVSGRATGGAKYQEPAAPDVSELPELPEEWCWTSLGQCFRVCVGATPSRKEPSYWNGAIPWVSSGEVQFNRISATKEYITESGLRNSSTQVNPIGSVLLGMIGEGKTRGQAAILATEACNNQNCAAVRVPETPISPEYVYYWLWSQYEQTRQVGAGNSQHALNKQRVEEIIFPLSPLVEQQEIVRRVETLFRLAEAIEKRTAAAAGRADRLTQAILAKAFRGELVPTEAELARAEGRGYETASALLKRVQAEQPGRPGRAAKSAVSVKQSSNGL